MAYHQALRNTRLLDDGEVRGLIADALPSALGVNLVSAKIARRIDGRVLPEQILRAAIDLLREREIERAQLAAELDRAEVALEELDALRKTRGW